jgi:2',3'-cyclic-nucleotide 2'-phosphodiesterase (5'-nucleotidase family)
VSLALLAASATDIGTASADVPGAPNPLPLPAVAFEPIGHYSSGLGSASAEIATAEDGRLFSTNGANNSLDVINFSDPTQPTLLRRVDLSPYGGGPNSVAVKNGLVAVAVEASPKTSPGKGVFLDLDGNFVAAVSLGALPDMVTFNRDGSQALFANEGEPNSYNQPDSVDPEGSVSIVAAAPFRSAAAGGVPLANPQQNVKTVSFTAFNVGGPRNAELPLGIRIYGPGASVAQDLEPEYIAVSDDNKSAFVTLQENNAIAEIDLKGAMVKKIRALGLKDHSRPENALDPSDRDNAVKIGTWPVRGMYEPDAIAAFKDGSTQYYITANEGDARDYTGFSEEVRIGSGSVVLDPAVFPDATTLKQNANLGRLNITTRSPKNGSGQYTELWSLGGRSFSIWKASSGQQISDTGDDFEQIVAQTDSRFFNASHENNNFDDRSDNKGPEPEGVAVGVVNGRRYAFVGLERIGGLMIYDITNPAAPTFVQYTNPRDFTVPPSQTDSGPEGVQFIPAKSSPIGTPLVVVANEISGTVNVYRPSDPDGAAKLSLYHNNDGETSLLPQQSGGMAVAGVSAFKSVTDREIRDSRAEGNSVLDVYAGDAFLASAALTCSLPPNVAPVFDAVAQRQIPYDAHVFGNHEFDLGSGFLKRFIQDHRTNGVLNQPFLSSNLNFTPEPSFANLLDADGLLVGWSSDGRVVARSKIHIDDVTGERFGVVGATTWLLPSISSPQPITVIPDQASTAVVVQDEIDRLLGMGIDKIVFVSHLQDVNNDKALIALLSGVDLAVAGGGDELLENPAIPNSIELLPGETQGIAGVYPLTQTDAEGRTVYIVTTSGNYRYVGRIDVEFDANGEVSSIDTADSYPRRVIPKTAQSDGAGITDSVLLDPGIESSVITPVNSCLTALNNPILRTEVVLDTGRGTWNAMTLTGTPGNRRTETNTGNSVTDAYLRAYDVYGPAAGLPARGPANQVVAIANGGGIRDNGGPVMPPGGVVPGTLSRKNTLDVLAFFTNKVGVVVDLSPAELKSVMERAASALPLADGRFLQVAGMDVVYDVSGTAEVLNANGTIATPGTRVMSITLDDGTQIVSGGAVVGAAPSVDVVTVNFTYDGGDGYTQLSAIPASRKVLLPPVYEQAWVEYLLTFPVEGGFPSIDSTDTRYASGGEGRITIMNTPTP